MYRVDEVCARSGNTKTVLFTIFSLKEKNCLTVSVSNNYDGDAWKYLSRRQFEKYFNERNIPITSDDI